MRISDNSQGTSKTRYNLQKSILGDEDFSLDEIRTTKNTIASKNERLKSSFERVNLRPPMTINIDERQEEMPDMNVHVRKSKESLDMGLPESGDDQLHEQGKIQLKDCI